MNEERRLHRKVCNVSYPFFRAKAKVEAGAAWGGTRGGGRRHRREREMEVNRGGTGKDGEA